jgi:3-isopropylmalate dehydratase small subunit
MAEAIDYVVIRKLVTATFFAWDISVAEPKHRAKKVAVTNFSVGTSREQDAAQIGAATETEAVVGRGFYRRR